jgi:hypothetical protein
VHFTGSIQLRGTNNKVIGNKFTGWKTPGAVMPGTGTQAEIAYNEFSNPAPYNPTSCPSGTTQFRMAIKMFTDGDGGQSSVHTDVWAHHNHVHDLLEKPCPDQFASAQGDAMEPGESNYDWTPTFECGWYIEDNLNDHLPQTGGGATYDLKCGHMVVRRNTVKATANSRIDIRFGSNTVVESNWLENGSTTVHGGYHKLACNYYGDGKGIQILAGDVEWNSGENSHPRAMNVLVAKNSGKLKIGEQNERSQTLPASRTIVEGHRGSISEGLDEGTSITSTSNYSCSEPSELSPTQVGPAAMNHAPAPYLACRVE